MDDFELLDAEEVGALLRSPVSAVRRLWRIGLLAYVEPTRNRRFSTRDQIAEYKQSVTRPCRSAPPPSSNTGDFGCSGGTEQGVGRSRGRNQNAPTAPVESSRVVSLAAPPIKSRRRAPLSPSPTSARG